MNFRFLILSVIWLILIASIFSSKAEILEEHPTLALSGEMSIDNRLQVLLQLSDQNIGKAIKQIQPLYDVIDSLNAAEQHVLIQIMLKGALNDNDLLNATNQMERIKALEKTIPESQLAQPIFYRSHLIFASIYAAQGDYKNGYLEKIEFSKKYNEFNEKEKDKAVAQLNQKYETEKKS